MAKTPSGKRIQPTRPYSDDKKTKGRRTGQTVKAVARDEDDFEDFDELYRENEPPPPSRPFVTPRSRRISSALGNERSGLGSEEMSIVDDPSPSKHVASFSRLAPSSVSHLSSLSRRVDRSRTTDFDAIPSPGPSSGPARLSNGRSSDLSRSFNISRSGPKPRPIPVAHHPTPSPAPQDSTSDSETGPMDMYDNEAPMNGVSSPEPVASPPKSARSRKSRRTSPPPPPAPDSESDSNSAPAFIPSPTASPPVFASPPRSRAYVSSDAEDDQPPLRSSHKAKSSKGGSRLFVMADGGEDVPPKSKGKAREILDEASHTARNDFGDDLALDDESDVHEDSRRSMPADEEDRTLVTGPAKSRKGKSNVNRSKKALSPVEEEEEEQPAEYDALGDVGDDAGDVPSTSRKRKTRNSPKKKKKIKPKPIPVESTAHTDEGLRRSTRRRFRPLEYWRGEKLIFGRSENGPAPCPIVKALYELPPETHETLGVSGRKRKRRARSQSASHPPSSKRRIEDTNDLVAPEEGWDAETPLHGPTVDYDAGEEVVRRVACTAANMNPEEIASGPFAYQKIFMDGDFIASGIMTLPVDGKKPLKSTRDNTYVFFCHAGAVRVRIHTESYIFAPGSTFLVPRGNQYEITNISKRESVLFFAQARMIMREDLDNTEPLPRGSTAHSSVVPSPAARSPFTATPTKGSEPKTKAGRSGKRRK